MVRVGSRRDPSGCVGRMEAGGIVREGEMCGDKAAWVRVAQPVDWVDECLLLQVSSMAWQNEHHLEACKLSAPS